VNRLGFLAGAGLGFPEGQHVGDAVAAGEIDRPLSFCLGDPHVVTGAGLLERAVRLNPRAKLTVGQRLFHRAQFLTDLGSDLLGGAPQTLDLGMFP